ncbi:MULTISPECIES: hypothetical protein [unclassified Streptomyces]|uniref:hypothetical protein n=1 Tax=unclassified Streptomyces TaxID=2593676 RepID=UPI0036CDBA3E
MDRAPGDDRGAHGIFDGQAHPRSCQATLAQHPALAAGAFLGALTAARWALRRSRGRTSTRCAG